VLGRLKISKVATSVLIATTDGLTLATTEMKSGSAGWLTDGGSSFQSALVGGGAGGAVGVETGASGGGAGACGAGVGSVAGTGG